MLPSFTEPPNTEAKELPVPSVPGGGLTSSILSSLDSKWPIPTISLLQFAFEGDNRGDAGIFVALLNRVLKLNLQSEFSAPFNRGYSEARFPLTGVTEPESWKQGLFGTLHDQTMFG